MTAFGSARSTSMDAVWLSCGISQQMLGVFLQGALLIGYVLLWEHWRLWDLSATSPWAWVALLVGVDFAYYWVATGSHRFAGRRGDMSFDLRVERIYDPDDLEAKQALCTEVFRYENRLEEEAAARCQTSDPWGVPDDPAYRKIHDVVRLEALLSAIPDQAFAQEARRRFLQRFGWEARHYYFVDGGNNPDGGGRTLLEVPVSEWTRRTVAYAVWYGKEHGLGNDVVARLEAALDEAPSHRCRRAEVYFIKDHLGGGRYGEIEPGSWGFDLRDGEIVDCATVSKVPQEAWGMRGRAARSTTRRDLAARGLPDVEERPSGY